ncbi:hypothetical protein [Falsihalocynthiibacter arcticus]
MTANILFYAGLLASLSIGFIYFRDLGDVSQMILKVKRKNMIRFIQHEYKFIAVGLGSAVVMLIGFIFGGGMGWLFWI